jgi:hypothetical protein
LDVAALVAKGVSFVTGVEATGDAATLAQLATDLRDAGVTVSAE